MVGKTVFLRSCIDVRERDQITMDRVLLLLFTFFSQVQLGACQLVGCTSSTVLFRFCINYLFAYCNHFSR
jgi:hypothetical protein